MVPFQYFSIKFRVSNYRITYPHQTQVVFWGFRPLELFKTYQYVYQNDQREKLYKRQCHETFSEKFENFSTKKFYNLFCRAFHADHFDIYIDGF